MGAGRQRRRQERRRGLWGTITDERERQALIVAAENVPGVEEVHDHIVWVEPMSGMAFPSPEDEDRERRAASHQRRRQRPNLIAAKDLSPMQEQTLRLGIAGLAAVAAVVFAWSPASSDEALSPAAQRGL